MVPPGTKIAGMPVAEALSKPPMVVGIRQTSREMSTVIVTGVPCASVGASVVSVYGASLKAEGRFARVVRNFGHSRARDAEAIRYHYDVSNEFYQQFLDPAMVYSCAYFETPEDSLEQAQRNKLEHICRKLRLRAGQRVFEAGCGWGGFAETAAREARAQGKQIGTVEGIANGFVAKASAPRAGAPAPRQSLKTGGRRGR